MNRSFLRTFRPAIILPIRISVICTSVNFDVYVSLRYYRLRFIDRSLKEFQS